MREDEVNPGRPKYSQKRKPRKSKQVKYKVGNWGAYNASLCRRGSLTVWFDDAVLAEWSSLIIKKKEVGEEFYSDGIVQCCLLIKSCFGLRLRQSTGFVSSILTLTGRGSYPVPDYTTLCRRQKRLPRQIGEQFRKGANLTVGIDSTGLKVFGEGEWKVRKHGWGKHRTWRKLHICIDMATQEILSVELTGNEADDASTAGRMLRDYTGNIGRFIGDGAYDKLGLRKLLGNEVEQVIPPPSNAVVRRAGRGKPLPDYLRQRNEAVRQIDREGLKWWKDASGYHKRSLNEVVMYRYKTTFGGTLAARSIENQRTEVNLKCLILNKFSEIGMPDSYKES